MLHLPSRFSHKDYKTVGPVSCIFSVTWLADDVEEPTYLSKRVGHVVSGLAVPYGLVLFIGLISLHLSPLDRIVQEKSLCLGYLGL